MPNEADAIDNVEAIRAENERLKDALSAAQQAKVPDAGRLWSYLRNVMQQGAAIAKDYEWARNTDDYERHSARLDAAASERTDELIALLSAQSVQEGKPAIAHNGVVMQDDANRRDFD